MNNRFANIPPVVKYLLIINGAMFLFSLGFKQFTGTNLSVYLGLHYYQSPLFEPFQIITHMFMHADFFHLFFNMYALFLFGSVLEAPRVWGSKKFIIYYMVTGFGAAALHTGVNFIQVQQMLEVVPQDYVDLVMGEGAKAIADGKNYTNAELGKLNGLINGATVGASGAVFGLLLAFGMLFPNVPLYLFFVPVPIKAKYFVMGYGALELISGFMNRPGDNVAHFAHLGGMLFGFILIKIWGKNENQNQNKWR